MRDTRFGSAINAPIGGFYLSQHLHFMVEFAHVFPGAFVSESGPHDGAIHLWLQQTVDL